MAFRSALRYVVPLMAATAAIMMSSSTAASRPPRTVAAPPAAVAVAVAVAEERLTATLPGPGLDHHQEMWLSPAALASDEAERLLDDMNAVRERAGLPALSVSADLTRIARARSSDLGTMGYFAHVSPSGQSAATMLFADAVNVRQAAENLVRAHAGLASIDLLLASAPHRANILDPAFDVVGVGAHPTGERSFVIATVFAESY